ncbi:MAG TPA: NADH-quinone oxidoreductase subunit NuoK [Actinomycetota bacterium]|nr:NADH-quinone oxidoreductase subunit NuoK [Actinomycetota bacterium]
MLLAAPLLLGAFMFSAGVYGVLARRNGVMLLMSIELMVNAANINLIAFSQYLDNRIGNVVALFVVAVTAAEVGIGLAIVMMLYRQRSTVSVDDLQIMKW